MLWSRVRFAVEDLERILEMRDALVERTERVDGRVERVDHTLDRCFMIVTNHAKPTRAARRFLKSEAGDSRLFHNVFFEIWLRHSCLHCAPPSDRPPALVTSNESTAYLFVVRKNRRKGGLVYFSTIFSGTPFLPASAMAICFHCGLPASRKPQVTFQSSPRKPRSAPMSSFNRCSATARSTECLSIAALCAR